jgi:hypothetical protein
MGSDADHERAVIGSDVLIRVGRIVEGEVYVGVHLLVSLLADTWAQPQTRLKRREEIQVSLEPQRFLAQLCRVAYL